jgi:hypothetical protein
MNLAESTSTPSAVEMLLTYHRLLRIVKEECPLVLDEDATARLLNLVLDRIQRLEFTAALQLEEAREIRGCRK